MYFFREAICHQELNIFCVSIVDIVVSKSYVYCTILRQEMFFIVVLRTPDVRYKQIYV